jgi:hypothetical protein
MMVSLHHDDSIVIETAATAKIIARRAGHMPGPFVYAGVAPAGMHGW